MVAGDSTGVWTLGERIVEESQNGDVKTEEGKPLKREKILNLLRSRNYICGRVARERERERGDRGVGGW